MVLSASAHADRASDAKAEATVLFNDAQDLIDAGNWTEACAKFEASYALDPQNGTRLNVADCSEHFNKLATAWALFIEAAESDLDVDAKRRDYALKRASALRERLPRLSIDVSPQARIPGLVIARDGRTIAPVTLAAPIYIDPGEHVITAQAPGKRAFSAKISVKEREHLTVKVPPFEIAPELVEARRRERRRVVISAAIGVGGAALIGVGLGFGRSAGQLWDDAFVSGRCDRSTLTCTPEGQKQTERADTRANISNALVAGGAVLLATSVIVYVTRTREHKRATVVPTTGAGTLGLSVAGHF
jgi:hypothetical protein